MRVGNIVRIGKECYEILKINERVDCYDVEKKRTLGRHRAIELHKIGDPSLHPTHLLKMYHDGEVSLFRIIQEKSPEWLESPRQRGGVFRYVDGRKIATTDITVE